MKNRLLFFITVVLLVIVSLVIFITRSDSSLRKRDRLFRIESPGFVTGIELDDREGSLDLSLVSGQWTVNGEYPANQQAVSEFLDALVRLRMLGLVPARQAAGMIRRLDTSGVHLKVRGGKRSLADFFILQEGETFLLRNAPRGKPLLGELAGQATSQWLVAGSDEKQWREKVLFRYQPEQIREVSMDYVSPQKSSFRIYTDENRVWYTEDPATGLNLEADQRRAIQYISYFYQLRFESFTSPDSLNEQQLFCTLSITGIDQMISRYIFYRKGKAEDSGTSFDPYRFYGMQEDDPEPVILRYLDADPILKDRSYFLPGEKRPEG